MKTKAGTAWQTYSATVVLVALLGVGAIWFFNGMVYEASDGDWYYATIYSVPIVVAVAVAVLSRHRSKLTVLRRATAVLWLLLVVLVAVLAY